MADAGRRRAMQARVSQVPETGIARFGRRNLLYILFVLLTIGSAILIEITGASGVAGQRLVSVLVWFWGIGSIAFFVVNAILVMLAVVKKNPARKATIGCALPTGLMILLLILAQFLPA